MISMTADTRHAAHAHFAVSDAAASDAEDMRFARGMMMGLLFSVLVWAAGAGVVYQIVG
jgi:hypothetical protein